jgi:hypothetical protein
MLSTLLTMAWAGSGPWVVAEGDANVYVGAETQRIEQLVLADGNFVEGGMVDVDEGLTKFGVQAIVSYGLLPNFELEATVPWYFVRANREDGAVCASLGPGSCATTTGVGILSTRVRLQLLNEIYGPPLSLSLGAELRYGDFTAATRSRVTNLGEGTVDLGPQISIGRSGGLGKKGYWYSFLDAGWRYRFPTVHGDGTHIPGSEVYGELDWVAVPDGRFGFGPSFTLFWRPEGVDFGAGDLTDVDRFAALRVLNVQVGGKISVRSSKNVTFNASFFRSLYAENNPLLTSINVGVSISELRRKRGE